MRIEPVNPDQMTDEQHRVYDEIVRGPRGSVRGPFRVLLKCPEAASRMQRLGEYLRFGSVLSARIRMLAVLLTARAWTAQYEWQVHVPQALKAGISETVIGDIAARRHPTNLQPDESVIYDFCTELQETKRVSESTYRSALDLLGEQGLVELVVLNGYFTAVAMALNVFEVDVPDKSKTLLV